MFFFLRNRRKGQTSRKKLVLYCETRCYSALNPTQPRAGLRTPVQMGGANGEWVEVCWLRVGLREVA